MTTPAHTTSPPQAGSAPLSPETASPRQRGAGIAMMLGSSVANQSGAALGALAFPAVGPVGVVAVRQTLTALVLMLTVRPRLRSVTSAQWWPVLGLAAVFSVMNISLYLSIERIGLGLAVTLEFLGPLAVAIGGSRRALDLSCAVLAGVGVVVLTDPGPSSDFLGIALALLAGLAWGSYILLNRTLGQRLPGLHGTALASMVTAALWAPIGIVWFAWHPPTVAGLGLAMACGVLSSLVPYATDLVVLRRVPAHLFGTVTSVNPVWAALAGLLLLDEHFGLNEWIGIGLIVGCNVVVTARAATGRRSHRVGVTPTPSR